MSNERKILFVDSLQFRIILILGLICIATTTLICTMVYFYLDGIEHLIGFSGLPPKAIATEVHTLNALMIWKLVGIFMVVTSVFIGCGLWMTHRVAGPLYKLRLVLPDLLAGKPVAPFVFRETDEFNDVFKMINRVTQERS